jgi:2-polyprenyl-3-methyl-5-hydroxy-6-metoxy-1,4-benzoquinol methylase
MIEHLTLEEIPKMLQECHRVLREKGRLVIGFPDIKEVAQDVISHAIDPHQVHLVYGDQDYSGDFHKSGLSIEFLSELLLQAGFRVLETKQIGKINKWIIASKIEPVWPIKELTIEDTKDFFDIRSNYVKELLRDSTELANREWIIYNGNKDPRRYYDRSVGNLLLQLYWNGTPNEFERKKYITNLVAQYILPYEHILDYGGGEGTLCMMLSEHFKNVYYFDIGLCKEFMEWRIKKHDLNINLYKIDSDHKYKAIICIDVLEHIKNYKIVIDYFVDILEDDGYLFYYIGKDPSEKYHFHVSAYQDIKDYIESKNINAIEVRS